MAEDCPILVEEQMNYRNCGLRNVETCHGMSLRPDGLRFGFFYIAKRGLRSYVGAGLALPK
jgi:hypothetical protein